MKIRYLFILFFMGQIFAHSVPKTKVLLGCSMARNKDALLKYRNNVFAVGENSGEALAADKEINNVKQAELLRKIQILRMNLTNENYFITLCDFLEIVQTDSLNRRKIYKNSYGKDVIGFAFLIDSEEGKAVLRELNIDLQELKNGKEVTRDQLTKINKKMFEHQAEKMNALMKQAGIEESFESLPNNLKIAMHSMYISSPNTIGKGFLSALKEYLNILKNFKNHKSYNILKERALLVLVYEIERRTNPRAPYIGNEENAVDVPATKARWQIVQNRRNMEGLMIRSRTLDVFCALPQDLVLERLYVLGLSQYINETKAETIIECQL